MPPSLSLIVPNPWPPSRKVQQLAARPWSPCLRAGLSEPDQPHITLVVLPALPATTAEVMPNANPHAASEERPLPVPFLDLVLINEKTDTQN